MIKFALLLLIICLSSHFTLQAYGYSRNGPWSVSDNCTEFAESLNIPANLKSLYGQKSQAVYYAKGLQHYSSNGSAWLLFNATADLYAVQEKVGGRKLVGGGHKEIVGRHFYLERPDIVGGQPSWETFVPASSRVTARALREVVVDPNSIPWGLLQATSSTGTKDLLGSVTYVQRVASKGGLPPSTTMGVQFGDVYTAPFSAIYVFYNKID